MFEKEAEEYYYKKVFAETNPKNETELKEKFLQTFKDGAEFGYYKGREEARKIIGNLYAICKDNHYPDCSVLMEQAEQFLKEIDGGRRMTDEEMAKEYIQNGDVFDNNKVTIKSVEQAFIAGLKAGRKSRWHKVADGDLPEYGIEVFDENGDKVRYEREGYSEQYPLLSGWIAYSEYEERDIEVDAPIAWCEVPEFEEDI